VIVQSSLLPDYTRARTSPILSDAELASHQRLWTSSAQPARPSKAIVPPWGVVYVPDQ